MTAPALEIHAGTEARWQLLERGLRPQLFEVLVGASGGAKWLVLSALDRVLFPWLMHERREPLRCVGSSIGAWRHLCLAQPDPAAATARFEAAYIAQTYTGQPSPAEVSRVSRGILDHAIGREGARHVVQHAALQTHIVTVRGRGPWRSQRALPLAAATAATVTANLLRREWLDAWLERTCFHTGPREQALDFTRLGTRYRALAEAQVAEAAMASGSIPLLAEGVEGLEQGEVYWDGGMTDYHFEPGFATRGGLVLFPHFYPFMAPGWFDKPWRWRHTRAAHWPRLVLLAPSREFVAALPCGKLPDRRDFRRMPTALRQRAWREVTAASVRLAEEFSALCEGRGLEEALR